MQHLRTTNENNFSSPLSLKKTAMKINEKENEEKHYVDFQM